MPDAELDDDMGQVEHCPVSSCHASRADLHAGCQSLGSLRVHVDAHLLGALPGMPPQEWLQRHNVAICPHCGRSVSRRCNNGAHRICMAQQLRRAGPAAAPLVLGGSRDVPRLLGELPDWDEICLAPVDTRDTLGAGILPKASKAFLQCVAGVLLHHRPDAWSVVRSGTDTLAHQRARLAWTELWMFPKACLAVLPGGAAKQKRNGNILANRLERWLAGERRALWDEATRGGRPGRRPRRGDAEDADAAAQRLQGLPGQAVQRLCSEGLAPDTAYTEGIMRSKFPAAPAQQHASRRLPAADANELGEEQVLAALRSFKKGVAARPSGLRPDFLRQLACDGPDARACTIVLTGLVNLLAGGGALVELQPYLAGAKGTALKKTTKSGEPDARPICSGEALRRLVGKALLRTEMDTLREHLLPCQLAVGVPAGAEVMPLLARQWWRHYEQDTSRILLTYDEGNAHNVVDRHAFLTRMREVCPGLSRWLEYIYPTAHPTKVFYNGRILDSAAGGQQGCPLMMACHGVVQRLLLESIGVLPVLPGSAVSVPLLDPPARLDMAPCYADDGILAGPAGEVLRALRHMQQVMPSLGLTFSSLEVAAPAGANHTVDWAPFVAAGCSVSPSGGADILKCPVGPAAFCEGFALTRGCAGGCQFARPAGRFVPVALVVQLFQDDSHGSHHPLQLCRGGVAHFDDAVLRSFGRISGLVLSDQQRAPHYLFVMVVVDFALLSLWLMRPTLVPGPRPTSCALTIGHFSIGM